LRSSLTRKSAAVAIGIGGGGVAAVWWDLRLDAIVAILFTY